MPYSIENTPGPRTSLRGVDLFSGAGGMSLGASLAGISVLASVESDPHAAKTYYENHRATRLLEQDVATISDYQLRELRSNRLILFGGPPCQGFSFSNLRTRTTNNPNNWLFTHFFRAVRIMQPEWVVFENVRGLVNTARGIFLEEILSSFRALKYEPVAGVLNAVDFGVPQDRARLFVVGSREGVAFKFPNGGCRRPITVRNALADLPNLKNGDAFDWLPFPRQATSNYARMLRAGATQCSNHFVTRNADYVLRRYRTIPPGGNWQNIPASMMSNYADRTRCHTGIYHRLDPNKPSVVIGNFRKNMLIHPTQHRGFSVREAARLQSFPDSYIFHGSIGFQQQQVGNAVPPLLAKQVFAELILASG